MKTLIISLVLLISGTGLFSQKNDKHFLNYQHVKGNYLYASSTETTNVDYQEYLFYLKENESESEYQKAMPDTTVWRTPLGYNEPYVKYYLQHPAYKNYPVVGVSREQAEDYCKWLTVILNSVYFNTPVSEKETNIKTIIARLPTEKEWEYAAKGGLPASVIFPWGTESVRRSDKKYAGQIMANFMNNQSNYAGITGTLNDNSSITAETNSFWPNGYNLYNMSGNVAEWTQEGKAKGGSWKLPGYYLQIDADYPQERMQAKSSDIGFRIFIEVVDFKDDNKRKTEPLTFKKIESEFVYIPNGSFYTGFDEFDSSVTDSLNNLFGPNRTDSIEAFEISKYEVSNRMYRYFLDDLKKNNEAAYQRHKSNNALWDNYMHYKYFQRYGTASEFDDFPVVNISYEAAQAYCDWLTEKYHSFEKRKYKKVRFRLPDNFEWEYAARGGLSMSIYPWGGPYLRNAQGEYLCNFNPREERFLKLDSAGKTKYDYPNGDISVSRALDGGDICLPVNSYAPNDYGLYNCAGNAAEMVAEEGFCRGGSWNSIDYDIQTGSIRKYQKPEPWLGFRVLMEIVEE